MGSSSSKKATGAKYVIPTDADDLAAAGFGWVQDPGSTDLDYQIRLKRLDGGDYTWIDEPQSAKLHQLASRDLESRIQQEFDLECAMLPPENARGACNALFPILHSKDIATNGKIIVFVIGDSKAELCQWSRFPFMNGSLAEGTLLPFLHEAIRVRSCAVLLTNSFHNSYFDASNQGQVPIPGHGSPEEHLKSLYRDYLERSAASEIVFIAFSVGGLSVISLLSDEVAEADLVGNGRLKGVVLAESEHARIAPPKYTLSTKVQKWLSSHAIHYRCHKSPLRSQLPPTGTIPCVSTGTPTHFLAMHASFKSIWQWIDARLLPTLKLEKLPLSKLEKLPLSELEKLPQDIFSPICNFLSGAALSRLHASSKTLMDRTVFKKTVTRFSCDAYTPIIAFPKISSLFRHLETFILIAGPNSSIHGRVNGKDIFSLPPTLTTLRLDFKGAHSIWFKHYSPAWQDRRHVSNIQGHETDFKHVYDIAGAFPVLRTLELNDSDPFLVMRLLPLFSPSLTSFSMYSATSTFDVQRPLPANLLELSVMSCKIFDFSRLNDVPMLQSLTVIGNGAGTIGFLPPTLHTLHLGNHSGAVWTPESLNALSNLSNLTSLQHHAWEVLEHLPPGLKELSYTSWGSLDVAMIKTLPKRLESFICFSLGGDLSDFGFWPPTLKRLEITLAEPSSFTPTDPRWLQLPRSLTTFKIVTNKHSPIIINPSFLPPCLRNTITSRIDASNPPEIDYSHLCALESLVVEIIPSEADDPDIHPQNPPQATSSVGTETQFDQNSKKTLDVPSLAALKVKLPNRLQRLQWHTQVYGFKKEVPDVFLFRDHFSTLLPVTLTSLQIIDARYLTDAFLAALPKLMISLSLETRDKSFPSHFSSNALRHLPIYLTSLTIPLDTLSDDSFVPYLPRGLVLLKLDRIQSFSDSMVPFLPRGLTYLHMRHVVVGLTDACLSDLPSDLRTLSLEHNKTFTPEAFFAIPRHKLTNLDLRANTNFTKKKVTQQNHPPLFLKAKKYAKYMQ